MRKSLGFPTRWSHTNQAVQQQKMARGLKFRIKEVAGLHYLYSENKGADQLHGYREADLRLCYRTCKKPVFSRRGSSIYLLHYQMHYYYSLLEKNVRIFCNAKVSHIL